MDPHFHISSRKTKMPQKKTCSPIIIIVLACTWLLAYSCFAAWGNMPMVKAELVVRKTQEASNLTESVEQTRVMELQLLGNKDALKVAVAALKLAGIEVGGCGLFVKECLKQILHILTLGGLMVFLPPGGKMNFPKELIVQRMLHMMALSMLFYMVLGIAVDQLTNP